MKPKPESSSRIVEAGSAECARLCRKPDRMLKQAIDMDRAILTAAWQEAQHVKSVKRLEREAAALQREREQAGRVFKVRANNWADNGAAGRRASTSCHGVARRTGAGGMPFYGFQIRDKAGLLFPFQRTQYSSAGNSKQGRARELAKYGIDGAHVLDDGMQAFASNVGQSPEEVGAAFDQLELVNRSAAKNAKIVHHMIIQSLYELPPEEQFAMAKRYCDQVFGQQDLPYSLALHAPSEEGDHRNWHIHVVYSYRPMVRTGEGEWEVGRFLRSDLDNREQWDRMRYLLAEELNHTCEKAGLAKRYTHLSYAAAGVDCIPQTHLGPGLTAKVRRGEPVRENLRNMRIVAQNSVRHLTGELKGALRATVADSLQIAQDRVVASKVRAHFARAKSAIAGVNWAELPVPPSRRSEVFAGGSRNPARPEAQHSANDNVSHTAIDAGNRTAGRLITLAASLAKAVPQPLRTAVPQSQAAILAHLPTRLPQKLNRDSRLPRPQPFKDLGAIPAPIPDPGQQAGLKRIVFGALQRPLSLARMRKAEIAPLSIGGVLRSLPEKPLPQHLRVAELNRALHHLAKPVPEPLPAPAGIKPSWPALRKHASLPRPAPGDGIGTNSQPPRVNLLAAPVLAAPLPLAKRQPPAEHIIDALDSRASSNPKGIAANQEPMNAADFSALKSRENADRGAARGPAAGALPTLELAPEARQAVHDLAGTLTRKPSGLFLGKDGIARPIAAWASSFGVTEEILISEYAQQRLLPIFANQELALDQLERTASDLLRTKPAWRKQDAWVREEDIDKIPLRDDLARVREEYRRSSLFGELILRLDKRKDKAEVKSREDRMRQAGLDPERLMADFRRWQRNIQIAELALAREQERQRSL